MQRLHMTCDLLMHDALPAQKPKRACGLPAQEHAEWQLPEEGSQGAALHVLSHDANHIGLCIRLYHHAIEAQHIGVVQVGQHFCLTPEGL